MSEARHDSQPPAQGGNETGNGGSVQVIHTGGVAAGTANLPQEQQAALLRRHGGATTDGQTVVIINPPPSAKPRWRRTKRLLGNTALMFGLPLVGALIMIALGDSSVMAANELIAWMWWPATVLRLLFYIALGGWILPRLSAYIRHRALENLEAQREALLAAPDIDGPALQTLEDQRERVSQFAIPRSFILGLCLAVELLLLQLPYLLG